MAKGFTSTGTRGSSKQMKFYKDEYMITLSIENYLFTVWFSLSLWGVNFWRDDVKRWSLDFGPFSVNKKYRLQKCEKDEMRRSTAQARENPDDLTGS